MKLLACFLIAVSSVGLVLAKEPPPIPDFTRGDRLDRSAPHDWNLGPTGARGWVYAWKGESTESRQILVTAIDPDSPASDLLKVDDVIVGISRQDFESDARIALARAITLAESRDGKLPLLRWRNGTVQRIVLQLKPMGAYAATAPYDCKKSRLIVAEGCEAIAANLRKPDGKRRHPIVRCLNALALLASGDRQYLPLIKEEIEWAKTWKVEEGDLHSWSAGWVNLLLAEYLLTTGDSSVEQAISQLSYEIANGQSRVGTWGHRFAYEHNGILRGYGAMNQVGLSLTTSLIVAREAGIANPRVAEAIERSRLFLSFYAERGAIPYGDHHPWLQMHDDNGKASGAAVMFDLLEDEKPAAFFSRTATASYGVERETGHTGNFFNMLWALPGVSRSGPAATGAWIKESAWLLDLARKHDGSFDFLGKPGATGGEHSYRGWDCTGAYVLGYCIDRKKTRLTGAKPSVISPLSATQAAQIIEDGRGWMPATKGESYQQRSTAELMRNLSNWSPVVRERAAIALGARNDKRALIPGLIRLAQSTDQYGPFGACEALERIGAEAAGAVPVVTKLLWSDDFWLQAQAAEALAGIGEPARTAVPRLLELVAAEPSPADKRGYLQRYLAFALFDQRKGLLGKSIESVDRDQLRAAAVAVLKNQDGRARGSLKTLYQQLSDEEIRPLLPAIQEAIVTQSPSGVMFSDGIRMAGLDILSKQQIPEGVAMCIDLIELDRWGSERRLNQCLNFLKAYGPVAKSELPKLKEFAEKLYDHPKFKVSQPGARGHNEKMAKHYQTLAQIIGELES